jgi:site-specific recombinase XerD
MAMAVLGKLREELPVRYYARRTVKSYVLWVRRYLEFHGRRHPREMGATYIHSFLSHLATDLGVSASTQNQALSALLFLYRHVLETDVGELTGIARARQSKRVPTVLTLHEVKAVLDRLAGTEGLVARLLYGSGLRLLEALRLRVLDAVFREAVGSGFRETAGHRPFRQG